MRVKWEPWRLSQPSLETSDYFLSGYEVEVHEQCSVSQSSLASSAPLLVPTYSIPTTEGRVRLECLACRGRRGFIPGVLSAWRIREEPCRSRAQAQMHAGKRGKQQGQHTKTPTPPPSHTAQTQSHNSSCGRKTHKGGATRECTRARERETPEIIYTKENTRRNVKQ